MSIYTTDELLEQLADTTDRIGDGWPVRWSDDPQGGVAAAQRLTVQERPGPDRPSLVFCPLDTDAGDPKSIETIADLVHAITEAVDVHGVDLPVFWSDGRETSLSYLTAEQEMFTTTTVVIFPT